MPLAQGNVHPDVWEVELYLTYTLANFYSMGNSRDVIFEVKDYLTTEVHEIHRNADCEVDLIDFTWTLEKCEKNPHYVNSWDLAGNAKVTAFVEAGTERAAIKILKANISNTFTPCTGDLIIRWDSWLEDVAESPAA